MNSLTALADLDELVILCRDDKARLYIVEAVACYRSGAYRSAIVATWIAVCYDIIDKLRELALSGDKAAEQEIAKIERARSSNDLLQTLKFERGILTLAKDQFELISHLEYIDLLRLQEDRNRCAHPSLVSQDQAFNPSGELARLHIRSAVLHLLQHQPVQGKYALERLLQEINSEYFPNTTEKALQAFSSGPLKRPRDSLVRNLVIVLLKTALDPATVHEHLQQAYYRFTAALHAVKKLHRQIFDKTFKESFPSVFRALPDNLIHDGIRLLIDLEDYWDTLPQDIRVRIETFVTNLPTELFWSMELLMNYAPLQQNAAQRAGEADRHDIGEAVFFDRLPPVLSDRCVQLYLESGSHTQANDFASQMRIYADSFTVDQQRRILEGISRNNQLLNSNSVDTVIKKLRETKVLSPDEFERTLEEHGLYCFMHDPPAF
jgi:hypothetical protein